MIPFSAAMISALESGVHHRFVHLFELQMKSATDRLWTGMGDLSWNGETWIGVGAPTVIDDFEQGFEGGVGPASITLPSADPARIAEILSLDEITGRPAIFYVGIFDVDAGAILADPVAIFERRMRRGQLNRRLETFTLYFDHPLVDSLRRHKRTRSHIDQRDWANALGTPLDDFFVDVVMARQVPRQWPAADWKLKRGL